MVKKLISKKQININDYVLSFAFSQKKNSEIIKYIINSGNYKVDILLNCSIEYSNFEILQYICEHYKIPQKNFNYACTIAKTKSDKKFYHFLRKTMKNENNTIKDCSICLTNEKNIAFIPCGHVCTCVDCGYKVAQCPICRKTIKKVLRIYY